MPPVSAAEKSMKTQPFHLRKPMMGWLAAQVCTSVHQCALVCACKLNECLWELVSGYLCFLPPQLTGI